MATSYKILGQSAPANINNADLYTVPGSTQAIVSTILITNVSSSAATCRVFAVPSGGTASTSNAVVYDGTIDGNDFRAMTIGITLSQGDKLVVRSGAANSLNFQAFGSEVS